MSRAPGLDREELCFRWSGLLAGGRRRRGRLIAFDARAAHAALKRDGITVLSLEAHGPAPHLRARPRDITALARQLGALLRAGLALAPALELLARGAGSAPRIANGLARAITSGEALSAALRRYPRLFDPLFTQLIQVGETSGALAEMLAQLADTRERAAAQRAQIRAALTYPAVVLLFSLAIMGALLTWVVPSFAQVFAQFGGELPAPTRLVLAASAACAAWGAPLCAALLSTAAGGMLLVRRRPALRLAAARTIARLPLAGPLAQALGTARWCRALGTLLRAGTPLTDAFVALASAGGDPLYTQASAEIATRLRRGERLASAMRATRRFPPQMVEPVAVAEEIGALDTMLLDLAALGEHQVERRLAQLTRLAEPLLIVLLGGLIGILVIAMYLPIIKLGNVV
jgi:type IV pilus assembly protein PilC